MRLLDLYKKRKRDLLIKKIDSERDQMHSHGKYSLFDISSIKEKINSITDNTSLENFYKTINTWESYCNLPYDIGVYLDKLSKEYTVMIHRTNLGIDKEQSGFEHNENLESIMRDGLKNHGHLFSSGYIDKKPNLTLTMTPLTGIGGLINLVSSFKSNDSVIIAAFPKELVDDDGYLVKGHDYNEIYDYNSETPSVKSEFMIGVIIKKNNSLDEFYSKEEITSELNRRVL